MTRKRKKGTPNLTGRQRIKRSSFKIKVDWSGPNPVLDRDGFRLDIPSTWPESSNVYIDAQHQRKWQRIELGTVNNLSLPDNLELSEIGHNPITFHIRVTSPDHPGLLVARSSEIRIRDNREKAKPVPQGSRQLLMFADRELECGIPTKIEFPTSNQPMRILINKDCISLKHALDEETPQYMAYIIPPYVSLIANRLVSDAICDVFNPEDAGNHPSSPWQNQWNHLFSAWAGKGIHEIDYHDASEVTEWIDDILRHWSLVSGNPAADISRAMGGY